MRQSSGETTEHELMHLLQDRINIYAQEVIILTKISPQDNNTS